MRQLLFTTPESASSVTAKSTIQHDEEITMDLSRFPYLQGNYAPVDAESTFGPSDLRVEGHVPERLTGAFMRNGPNPAFQPNHYVYPLDGDGMIHAVYFDGGQVSYRNRWVQTRQRMAERRLGRAIYGSIGRMLPVPPEAIAAGADPSPLKNTANTNVIQHGGKLLAMWEGGFPHRMNADLSTAGLDDYDGALAAGDAFSAHPKICPVSGQMITLTQRWDEPFLTVRVFDRSGRHISTTPVHSARKHVVHDLQITDNWVILFYSPAFADIGNAMKGGDPFFWEPQHGARIALVPRGGGEVRWFETDAFFSWHFCNAFESGDSIHVDYIWIASIPVSTTLGTGIEKQPRSMHRMTLDLKSGAVRDQQVGTTYCEFARADDRLCGKRYRYGFATASNRSWDDAHGYNCTLRYDMDSGAQQLWEYGHEANAGEPVHVPDPASEREEDGYVMCFATNPGEGAFLSVLRAGDLSAGPVAKVHIPVRVPNGFHANWMPGLRLERGQ